MTDDEQKLLTALQVSLKSILDVQGALLSIVNDLRGVVHSLDQEITHNIEIDTEIFDHKNFERIVQASQNKAVKYAEALPSANTGTAEPSGPISE